MHHLVVVAMVATSSIASADPVAEAGGLRIKLELPAVVANSPRSIAATLSFENRSKKPIRILLVKPEVFRLFNSSLRVWNGKAMVSLQPEPHPHGHMLDEDDFAVIPAGETKTFAQTLYLKDRFTAPGDYEVEWTYENKARKFAGGAQTLDGVTKPLFGGTEVTDLWIGSLSTRRKLHLP
jgi:hypothetical protein